MSPGCAPRYSAVTEQPGQAASAIQLEMLEARYSWASQQARHKDVLEVACGAGMGLPVLAEAARSVQAGDVDAENLHAASQACAGKLNVGLQAFHAGELPFANECFDLVLLFEAIYYLPDVRVFLKETQRVLRPGGALLVVSVNPQWKGFNPSPLKTSYWSAGDLLKMLREENFAARVEGAFPEMGGWTASATGLLRRAAVALRLIPRTMHGKTLLKRIFYGPMQAVPPRLVSSQTPVLLEPLHERREHGRYRVLYATARKAIA